MPSKEERYRDLMGRIDSGTRKAQLEEELKQIRTAFMETHSNAERQGAFVKKHELELAALKKKEPTTTQYVSREAIIDSAKERAAMLGLMVEHLADEVEKLEGRIKEIDEAGLPKAKADEEATGVGKEE